MVLTSPEHSSGGGVGGHGSPLRRPGPPQRGTTLPAMRILGPSPGQSPMRPMTASAGPPASGRAARAHTLPSRAQTVQDLNNVINLTNLNNCINNNNNSQQLHQPAARNTPMSVSILSLPTSDNEGFNFANW